VLQTKRTCAADQRYRCRSNIRATCVAVQWRPLRAVGMPRSLSTRAIAQSVATPPCCRSRKKRASSCGSRARRKPFVPFETDRQCNANAFLLPPQRQARLQEERRQALLGAATLPPFAPLVMPTRSTTPRYGSMKVAPTRGGLTGYLGSGAAGTSRGVGSASLAS
jgi:hypothetical protein